MPRKLGKIGDRESATDAAKDVIRVDLSVRGDIAQGYHKGMKH